MLTIGIVGTAKNTGKTTALSAIIHNCIDRKIHPAITSIGYDGEDLDNLTYLPKPKLYFIENSIVATSELCLKNTKAKFEILDNTHINTPLGKIFIIKIIKAGELVIAGPNNIHDLEHILSRLKSFHPGVILVDGALNRMAPMYLADKIIFSTGASRSIKINDLVDEMKMISAIFKFPRVTKRLHPYKNICFENGPIVETKIFSLLSETDLTDLITLIPSNINRIYFPNIFSFPVLEKFIHYLIHKNPENPEIIFYEPFRLFLSINYDEFKIPDIFSNNSLHFRFLIKPEFMAITINPFYPRVENFHFRSDFIDKKDLREKMRKEIDVPIFNIFDDGVEGLLKLLL